MMLAVNPCHSREDYSRNKPESKKMLAAPIFLECTPPNLLKSVNKR